MVDFIPLIAVLLLLSSWLATNYFLPWVSWHAEALVFIAVLVSTWVLVAKLLSLSNRTRIMIVLPVLIWPFILLAVLALVQAIVGAITFWGDVAVICSYVAISILCIALGFRARENHRSTEPILESPVTLLAMAFVIAGLVSVVIAFAQAFELWENSPWIVRMPDLRRPGANLAQPNHFATLLVMGVASVVFLQESKKFSGYLCILLLVVFGVGLAMAESRTGVLGFFALLIWWLVKRPKIGSKTSPWFAAIVGAGFLTLFWIWPKFYAFVQLSEASETRGLEGGGRLNVWPQLIEALLAKPWGGWGIRQVAKAHNSVAHTYMVSEPFTYSHNLVLDLALWVGLPIAFIMLFAGTIWFWRRAKSVNQLLPWYCLAVAIPAIVHSMLEFPFAYAYFLAPVMFLIGVLEAHSGVGRVIRLGLKPALGMLLIISAGLAWMTTEYISIEEDFRIARFEALRIGQTPVAYEKPKVLILTQLGALLEATRVELRPGMSPQALTLLKDVALHYPWSATQYRYALALALNDHREEAARQFQVMRVHHGENLYGKIKNQLIVLAESDHPVLRDLNLP